MRGIICLDYIDVNQFEIWIACPKLASADSAKASVKVGWTCIVPAISSNLAPISRAKANSPDNSETCEPTAWIPTITWLSALAVILKMEQIGVISTICQNDGNKAAEIAGNLDLNENELAILLNTDKKNQKLISIMEQSQQYRQRKEIVTKPGKVTNLKEKIRIALTSTAKVISDDFVVNDKNL